MTYAPLRMFLSSHNLKLSDLQRELNISSATLSKIRKNQYLSMTTLISIAEFYHLSVEEIVFFGSDKEYIEKFYLCYDVSEEVL